MGGPDFDDSQGMTSVHFKETGDVYITIVNMIEILKLENCTFYVKTGRIMAKKAYWKLLAKLDFNKCMNNFNWNN